VTARGAWWWGPLAGVKRASAFAIRPKLQRSASGRQWGTTLTNWCNKNPSGKLEDYYHGVTGRVGQPNPDPEKGMRIEHTESQAAHLKFRTSNYDILTTPSKEYHLVESGGQGKDVSERVERTLRPLGYYLNLDIVKKAQLTGGEIKAVVIYTGPMFQILNGILRQAGDCGLVEEGVNPLDIMTWCEKAGHCFPSTICLLVSAVKKLQRASDGRADDAWVYRGLSGGQLPADFEKNGFAEWGFMSTTRSMREALRYSGVCKGFVGTILAMKVSQVDRGASLEEFSQYPREKEMLWNPLSFLEYQKGKDQVRLTEFGLVKIIVVKVNANGHAQTVEEMLDRRKNIVVHMAEALEQDVSLELDKAVCSRVSRTRFQGSNGNMGTPIHKIDQG
jgi:hypothetical protein